MHDAVRFRVRQPGQQALEHAADLRHVHPPDVRAQRAALDVLHRDVGRAVVLEVIVHGDDVRMRQRARHARLAQETLGERGIGGVEGAEFLERDEPIEVGLAGEVHHRHAAATHLSEDLVAIDDLECCHRRAREYAVTRSRFARPRPTIPRQASARMICWDSRDEKFNVFDAPMEFDSSDPEPYRAGRDRFGPKIGASTLRHPEGETAAAEDRFVRVRAGPTSSTTKARCRRHGAGADRRRDGVDRCPARTRGGCRRRPRARRRDRPQRRGLHARSARCSPRRPPTSSSTSPARRQCARTSTPRLRAAHVVVGLSGLSEDDYAELDAVRARGRPWRGRGGGLLGARRDVAARGDRRRSSRLALGADRLRLPGKPDVPSGTVARARRAPRRDPPARAREHDADLIGPPEACGASGRRHPRALLRLPGYVDSPRSCSRPRTSGWVVRHEAGSSADPYIARTLLAIHRVGRYRRAARPRPGRCSGSW